MRKWNDQCEIAGKPPVFDLSEFARHKVSRSAFTGTVGLFKHKQGDNPMVEAAYTAAKMYAYRCEEGEKSKTTLKGKGVPTKALERQYKNVQAYREAILQHNASPAQFRSIQSQDHVPRHKTIVKKALTADNDKVFLLSPHASRPLGHYKNKLEEEDDGWAGYELEDENTFSAIDEELKKLVGEPVEQQAFELVDEVGDAGTEAASDSEAGELLADDEFESEDDEQP